MHDLKFAIILFFIIWMLGACVKPTDLSDLTLEESSPILAFPLLEATITSDDLVAEIDSSIVVVVNEEGIFSMQFRADPYIEESEQLFPALTIDLPIPILDSAMTIPVPSFDGFNIQKGVLRGDQMSFVLNSTEADPVKVSIKLPQLTRDNMIFRKDYEIPGANLLASSLTTNPIDLNGFLVDFGSGTLDLKYEAVNSAGTRIRLPISFLLVNAFDFSYLEGSIQSSRINTGLQEIDIDIRDTVLNGDFQFQDPKIHFDISNSFGVPVGLKVLQVFMVDHAGNRSDIRSTLFEEIMMIEAPSFDEVGETVSTRITLDRDNSNLVEVASTDIEDLFYDVDIILNPNTTNETFFITDSSKAQIDALIDLSFDATIIDFTVEQDLTVALSGLDTLRSLRMKMYVENGIPLSFSPELIFFEEDLSPGFTLKPVDTAEVSSATVDSNGEVVSTTTTEIYFNVTAEELSLLSKMTTLKAILHFRSPNNGKDRSVIKPGQEIFMGIGAEAGIK